MFSGVISKAINQAERYQRNLALLLININPLSLDISLDLNQKIFEHAQFILQTKLRSSDTLLPRDHRSFIVLLTDLAHPKILGQVAEKLIKSLTQSFTINHEEICLTCNIGIATFPKDGKTLEALQIQAQTALDQATRQGLNHYQFPQLQRTIEAQDYTELQTALNQALNAQEFILHYQPQMDLKTRRIISVEALLRWQHPVLGLIDPSYFVASAEESGMMMKIGEWVLRQACLTNKQWQEQGHQPISIAVNLSPTQLLHPQTESLVNKILQETGLDPRYLDLEITEMTIMDDVKKFRSLLDKFKQLGVSLSLDDFGTGHTALQYLKDFPIDHLKIDQSFIKPLPQDPQNAAIVKALITVGHQLGCKIIAEGVETQEQFEYLAAQDCDFGQGYYISRPLPADLLKEWLK